MTGLISANKRHLYKVSARTENRAGPRAAEENGGFLYLHPGLRQVDFQRDLLPHEDVRVAGLSEQSLQDVELRAGEGGPLPPLLPGGRCGQKQRGDIFNLSQH